MKKIYITIALAFAILSTENTFAQQGFGTNQPDRSAAVEIVSSQRGLLIPRINIPDLNNAAPVNSPAISLFVYNTNTTSGVGFYYWDGSKWVRFTSTNNERDVIVQAATNGNIDIPTATYDANGVKTYNVSVKGGANGQVLVSNATGATEWINPEDFVKDVVNATNGLTYVPSTGTGVDNIIKLGGALTENTTITTVNGETDPNNNRSLTIAGLETVSNASHIMVMNVDGLLQKMERTALLDAKDLTLGDGLAFETGNGTGAVLVETKIEIEDKQVKAEKLLAENPAGAIDPLAGKVATADASGNVTYEAITPASLRDKKTLTGDGITVTAGTTVGTDSSVADALLADVTLGIEDGAITTTKLADGAVSPDKMTSFTDDNGTTTPADAGQVPVADGSGNVTYQNVATAIGQDLTTDGKIVIGNNTSTTQTLADAVLVATELSIANESITSADIKNGTIRTEDIYAPNSSSDDNLDGDINKVMVTDENGNVSWIDQSAIGNKDSYTGIGAINIAANGTSTNGINYDVSVATASGTTLGVVKEAATDPTVNINAAGELAVNLTNTVLAGDVTGPLNDTNVGAIQGTNVSPTTPIEGQVLILNSTGVWTPSTPTVDADDVTDGKALTSNSLTVPTNTSLLEALNIEITPGTEGQVLTTVNTAAPGDPAVLETNWTTVNSLVEADNGLNVNSTTDKIHLGGDLIEPTDIKTDDTNTLAISGLVAPTGADTDKIVIIEDNGVLRSITRSLTENITTDYTVANIPDYNTNVQEINIGAELTGSDINITLPTASNANKGQAINIKITNDNETAYYVNIIANGGTLTYGSMPYQGWIIKSNGSEWVIVGRN